MTSTEEGGCCVARNAFTAREKALRGLTACTSTTAASLWSRRARRRSTNLRRGSFSDDRRGDRFGCVLCAAWGIEEVRLVGKQSPPQVARALIDWSMRQLCGGEGEESADATIERKRREAQVRSRTSGGKQRKTRLPSRERGLCCSPAPGREQKKKWPRRTRSDDDDAFASENIRCCSPPALLSGGGEVGGSSRSGGGEE